MSIIIDIYPNYDWKGLFCPRCGKEVALSGSYCRHVTFSFINPANEFDHVSKSMLTIVNAVKSEINQMYENDDPIDDVEFVKRYMEKDDSESSVIFNVIFDGDYMNQDESLFGFKLDN